jgi:hypothetical protein
LEEARVGKSSRAAEMWSRYSARQKDRIAKTRKNETRKNQEEKICSFLFGVIFESLATLCKRWHYAKTRQPSLARRASKG